MTTCIQLKIDWNEDRKKLLDQLDALNKLLVQEKERSRRLRRESLSNVDELSQVRADRELNAKLAADKEEAVNLSSLKKNLNV